MFSMSPDVLQKHISRDDALASIRADYERNYFVSGEGELAAYDPECEFRDDFAAFNGVGESNTTSATDVLSSTLQSAGFKPVSNDCYG